MISGTLTPRQYLHALRMHRRKAVGIQAGLVLLSAVSGAIAFTQGNYVSGMVIAGSGVGLAICVLVQSKFTLPRQVTRIYRQQANLRAHYTYHWDDEWLSVTSEHAQAKRRWPDYIRLQEDEELLLLYLSDCVFEIFPKAWFSDPAQMDDFRRLASQGQAGGKQDSLVGP